MQAPRYITNQAEGFVPNQESTKAPFIILLLVYPLSNGSLSLMPKSTSPKYENHALAWRIYP